MSTKGMSEIVQHLRRVVLVRDGAGLTDGQLLESYVANRDEASFAALVRKHSPMVWGVCRRILHRHQDAEDAFQAAFLVLVRKGAQVVPREMVANWLYGVACQTALKVRATTAKRSVRERQVCPMPEAASVEHDLWNDLQPLLDQELTRLPDKFRTLIIFCDLEGKTRKETARQLGLPEGTVASRLARARTLLAKRLARRGLPMSCAVMGTLLVKNGVSVAAPTAVVSATIRAATLFGAGHAVAAGAISAKVATLTEGVLKAMLLSKLKIATATLLVAGMVIAGLGASGILYGKQGADSRAGAAAAPQKKGAKTPVEWKGKKETDWKHVEDEVFRLGLQQLRDVHPSVAAGDISKIRDCRGCHGGSGDDKGLPLQPESDKEIIKRLELELKNERAEKELLQLEVLILLREIQRQNLQMKGGR